MSDPVLCDFCDELAACVNTSGDAGSRTARCAEHRALGGKLADETWFLTRSSWRRANDWIRDPRLDLDDQVLPEIRKRNGNKIAKRRRWSVPTIAGDHLTRKAIAELVERAKSKAYEDGMNPDATTAIEVLADAVLMLSDWLKPPPEPVETQPDIDDSGLGLLQPESSERWGHSSEGLESWTGDFRTREEAIADGRKEIGDHFWIQRGIRPRPEDFAPNAADVVELMGERAMCEAGSDATEDFPEVTKAATDELDELLRAWVAKHVRLTFWIADGLPEQITNASDPMIIRWWPDMDSLPKDEP